MIKNKNKICLCIFISINQSHKKISKSIKNNNFFKKINKIKNIQKNKFKKKFFLVGKKVPTRLMGIDFHHKTLWENDFPHKASGRNFSHSASGEFSRGDLH